MPETIESLAAKAPIYKLPQPEPIASPIAEACEFPIEAMGELLSNAAKAIHDKTQAPLVMCAQSVLVAAATITQAHINIEIRPGQIRPTNIFGLCIAESGERKSAVDKIAMEPINDFQNMLREHYSKNYLDWKNANDVYEKERSNILNKDKIHKTPEQKQSALKALGPPPEKPLKPEILSGEPTIEGLLNHLSQSLPFHCVASDDAGEFFGGHSFKDDARLRTIATLSKLWDGADLSPRLRATGINPYLAGRRVSMVLLAQQDVAIPFISDRLNKSQGITARFLCTYPKSTQGKRDPKRKPSVESDIALKNYSRQFLNLLNRPLPTKPETANELKPRIININSDAWPLIHHYEISIESKLGETGELSHISGTANKSCENAIRIAAVIAFFDNPDITELSKEAIAKGLSLGQFYLEEASRLYDAGEVNEEDRKLSKLFKWLQKWAFEYVSIADIQQRGPAELRKREKLLPLIDTLEESGWLTPSDKPVVIDEKIRQKAWLVVREKQNECP